MTKKINILLAEDEPALGQIIKESLETRNFEVSLCIDGEMAFNSYKEKQPELLVLDVMMPKLDGFSLAQRIRKENPHIPIIFLTAKSQTEDVVSGFQAGGNDYLKKPFSMEELIVRMHNLLSYTPKKKPSNQHTIGDYSFDHTKQSLQYLNDKAVVLTHKESELLYHLCLQENNILNRSEVLEKLWGTDDFFTGRSMDVFITKLRKKLAKDPRIEIRNIRGIGYKLLINI
ncbi:MAG: response regulator transcription factor [Flavobacteriaceae bacterium]|nr:response regulator transcription factor [Flavobacteriaceae bacterium]